MVGREENHWSDRDKKEGVFKGDQEFTEIGTSSQEMENRDWEVDLPERSSRTNTAAREKSYKVGEREERSDKDKSHRGSGG